MGELNSLVLAWFNKSKRDLEKFQFYADEITPYATLYRYPGNEILPDETEFINIKNKTDEIINFVANLLEQK